MSGLAALIGTLLSALHAFPPDICPGDWPWTVTVAGALLAVSPVLGAVLVALIRKAVGNRYGTGTVFTFGLFGLVFGFLVPWLFGDLICQVFNLGSNNLALGLSTADVHSLSDRVCFFKGFGTQGKFLGDGQTVYEVFTQGGQGVAIVWYVFALIGLPLLCLLMVMLQQRAALRRGPGWPGRLMWLSFLGLILFSAPLEANVMAQLWLGFFPASVLGILVVLLFGSPPWSVINRAQREPRFDRLPAPPVRPQPQESQYSPQPAPRLGYQPDNRQSLPPTRVAAMPVPPPTAVARPPQLAPPPAQLALPPGPTRVQPPEPPAALADTPGPLPSFLGGDEPPTVAWHKVNSRFRRVRQLGHGGFGTVWLALDTQLDRTVALKLAHAPDSEAQARMLREARALAAVHHPNCVRVYDIAEDAEGLGIVMEYIEGQSLSEAVKEDGLLDDVAAARLWVTMAGALGDAHGKGVLHRDVKPANVLLDNHGVAHLIDFGIARTKGDVTLTAAGMMMGTPDFLAPETASTGLATPASDAWQLAATVSYALTGQPPRGRRANPMSALMAAAQQLPNTHLPERSRHLAILRAALDADPARRPTLATVEREVGNWLAGAGHDAEGPVTAVVHRRDLPTRQMR